MTFASWGVVQEGRGVPAPPLPQHQSGPAPWAPMPRWGSPERSPCFRDPCWPWIDQAPTWNRRGRGTPCSEQPFCQGDSRDAPCLATQSRALAARII